MKINEKFYNQIKEGRNLQLVISNLVRLSEIVQKLESQMAEIRKHLGMDKADEIGN